MEKNRAGNSMSWAHGMLTIRALLVAALCAAATCSKTTQKRVLVTGFLPFDQYPVNPSGDVARQLNGTCSVFQGDTVCFDGIVLPVNVTGSSLVALMIDDAAKAHGDFLYDAVLHMGLEDIAKGLKLETFALNQAVPANATFGMRSPVASCLNNSDYDEPTAPPAVAGAPCELPTTVDLGRLKLEQALHATSVSKTQILQWLLEGRRTWRPCDALTHAVLASVVQERRNLLLQR
jgi:pyrrolidone-carboxylate peptidase